MADDAKKKNRAKLGVDQPSLNLSKGSNAAAQQQQSVGMPIRLASFAADAMMAKKNRNTNSSSGGMERSAQNGVARNSGKTRMSLFGDEM